MKGGNFQKNRFNLFLQQIFFLQSFSIKFTDTIPRYFPRNKKYHSLETCVLYHPPPSHHFLKPKVLGLWD